MGRVGWLEWDAKWMGFVRKKNKVSFFIGWEPFRVLSSFKPALSHYSFLIPPSAIHFHFAYTCAYTLVVVHPILLSIIFPTWSEEGSLCIHVLMLRIEVFSCSLSRGKNDFSGKFSLLTTSLFIFIFISGRAATFAFAMLVLMLLGLIYREVNYSNG